ncbi:hypothetical protein PCANC_10282 [Puccinia coronata f. sp. avenae]|uniref:Uncharacterized protein n=1 Tax=Puccinia coronata f. sp. avenae TaxID=200324 RepID=A0A2N5VQ74_9BASI|nr:hypothetical protein PCANC_10282 [Puccinia coronata f. sp. avenae]
MQSTLVITFLWLWYGLSVSGLLDDHSKLEITARRVLHVVHPELKEKFLSRKTKDESIKELTKYSKIKPGDALYGFRELLVDASSPSNHGGKQDIGDTWERYVVAAVPEAFDKEPLSKASQPNNVVKEGIGSRDSYPDGNLSTF